VWLLTVVLYSWSLHIGGRSTPLLYWHGSGTVAAKSGKTYPFYMLFFPSLRGRGIVLPREGKHASANLRGMAWLCVAPGNAELLQVEGTMYGGPDDSLLAFRLLEWPKAYSLNAQHRGLFDVAGAWHGQQLVLDRPDEQSLPFKSGLSFDHATATLHWSSKGEFDAACRAMGAAR